MARSSSEGSLSKLSALTGFAAATSDQEGDQALQEIEAEKECGAATETHSLHSDFLSDGSGPNAAENRGGMVYEEFQRLEHEPADIGSSLDIADRVTAAVAVGVPSVGSNMHGTGRCKPCLFKRMRSGCKQGLECRFCHLEHTRKNLPRPAKTKRNRYRRLVELAEAHGAQLEQQIKPLADDKIKTPFLDGESHG